MVDATGLTEKIKKAALEAQEGSKPVQVIFGEVISTSPFKISTDQKFQLGERQLILARNVMVPNPLKIGEKVIILRIQGGQEFVVIDRIGGKP